jgi:glycine/D-amino acid oxidase-like deaminating enzyme
VVGGGILGMAAAAAVRRAGVGSVLLIEASRLGSRASGGAAGLLLPPREAAAWSSVRLGNWGGATEIW